MIESMPDSRTITEIEGKKMLSSYGIEVPRSILISGSYMEPEFQGPYVIKVSDPKIIHKTEVGGVVTGITSPKDLEETFHLMRKRFPDSDLMIEEMIPAGLEIIIGVVKDSQFGLAIMAGLGGIYAELLRDTSFRLVPLRKNDAVSMVMETKLSKFVEGFRGYSVSLESLTDVLMKLSGFAVDHEDSLLGIDLNPVIASGDRLIAADVKMIFKNITEQRDVKKERGEK